MRWTTMIKAVATHPMATVSATRSVPMNRMTSTVVVR